MKSPPAPLAKGGDGGIVGRRLRVVIDFIDTTETRTIISMVASGTFQVFPDLKIIVSHGGGAVPTRSAAIGPSSGATSRRAAASMPS